VREQVTTSPNVIWADLEDFDLSAGAPVMELNPDNIGLSGKVTDKFVQQVTTPFQQPEQAYKLEEITYSS
jgi:hypothetical protein